MQLLWPMRGNPWHQPTICRSSDRSIDRSYISWGFRLKCDWDLRQHVTFAQRANPLSDFAQTTFCSNCILLILFLLKLWITYSQSKTFAQKVNSFAQSRINAREKCNRWRVRISLINSNETLNNSSPSAQKLAGWLIEYDSSTVQEEKADIRRRAMNLWPCRERIRRRHRKQTVRSLTMIEDSHRLRYYLTLFSYRQQRPDGR